MLARMELKLCPAVPELHLVTVTQHRTERGYLGLHCLCPLLPSLVTMGTVECRRVT